MLFEAGALSQVGRKPRLFTYLYGISEVAGPLGHFQAKRLRNNYDAEWAGFEAKVLRLIAFPIQEVLPEFRELFVNKKTFDEPLSECSDKQWDSRIERIARIRERLTTAEFSNVMSSDPYMAGAYKTLLGLLSRYDMHVRSHLIQRLDFEGLTQKKQEQLEGVRKQILDVVRGLQQHCEPPVFRESFGFESDSSTPGRKMKIQEMQMKLSGKKLLTDKISRAGRSLNWGLDRIVFYLAVGSGDFSDARLDDLVDLLPIEEEQARTRDLVSGLQPLYYALECLDERISGSEDTAAAKRLIDLLGDIQRFISAREAEILAGI